MQNHSSIAVIVGASRGIGAALTEEFLLHGWTVVALARTPTQSRLDFLTAAYPARLHALPADVTAAASLDAAVEKTRAIAGTIDVLVNNAGILLSRETPGVAAYDPDELTRTLDVNTVGPLRVLRAFAGLLRTSPETSNPNGAGMSPAARVVNITSIMGSLSAVSGPRNYAYSVSKAALNMLTRLVHQELKDRGIGVWAMHPGWVRTDMGGLGADFSAEQSAVGLYSQIQGWRFGDPELMDFLGRPLAW